MEKILLHGTLHVTIYEAHGLSGSSDENIVEEFVEWIEDVLKLRKNEGKLFATIDIEGARVGRTRLIDQDKSSNIKWDEQFHIYVAHNASHIVFSLRQDEAVGSTPLGTAYLPAIDILNGDEIDKWLDILDNNHKPIHGDESKIHIKVKFIDVTKDVNWDQGVKSPEFPGVPLTFFPQRNQCRITLYQDSHVPNDFAPRIPLAYGMYYEPHRCWEDIFDAINNARHLIYIVGWSIYPEITLVRDIERRPKSDTDMTLGELLKKKAQEGVRVVMLVWDNVTETIETHDEETRQYFRHSQVYVELCARLPDEGKTVVQDVRAILGFTHHQKTVVVDSAMPMPGGGNSDSDSKRRRIVSFVGGLDLCDGRYDTPSHSLFRTLNSVHHNDFHQPNFKDSSINKGGPREPWHDIHSRLEGQVAWDVLYNFEQRCKKYNLNDILVNIQEMGDIFIPPSQVTFPNDQQETWNVQVFRSIDGGDAFGFPESPEEAAKLGLVTGKDNVFDRSIQDAYIHAIRRAKRFIYIENQYFVGSSFDWKPEIGIDMAEIKALQVIPKELSLKIVSKIQKGERFTVYVVIPMWPEGVPEGDPTKAILDWQRRTMEMMYTDITQALGDKGIEANPKDFLSFFCLGNREVKRAGEYEPSEKPEPDTDYSRAQANRRFMIYVHAKMMIVDDEYIIVGSANLNQRSMDGARDSEIAMGGYQPQHIWHGDQLARGQVHGFRMSLWYEHMGMLHDVFLNPETLDCVRKVNQIADKYWDLYSSSESLDCDLPGQLLTYPIQISKNGEIEWPPGFQDFPDTKAKILGQYISWLPPFITT